MTNTITVDLRDRIDEFDEDLDRIAEEAKEASGEEYDELEQEYEQTLASVDRLEEYVDGLDEEPVWTLAELNLAQALHAEQVAGGGRGEKDMSAEALEILGQAMAESPDGASENPGEYPIIVGMYLYEELSELMAGPEGNSRPTLAERMEKE
jgi:hypothetical protein